MCRIPQAASAGIRDGRSRSSFRTGLSRPRCRPNGYRRSQTAPYRRKLRYSAGKYAAPRCIAESCKHGQRYPRHLTTIPRVRHSSGSVRPFPLDSNGHIGENHCTAVRVGPRAKGKFLASVHTFWPPRQPRRQCHPSRLSTDCFSRRSPFGS